MTTEQQEAQQEAPKAASPPPPAPRTLADHVARVYSDVLEAKGDGYTPVQIMFGVAGRLGLNAWDFFVGTFDPGPKKGA